MTDVDIAIVGGGINGCAVARDAAGRGYSVALFEQNDLASATSSASTKLIHGGLRYLETYDFRLVAESLHEREVLLRSAPHLVRPIRFVLPHHGGLRPRWMLRLGLWLYDHLGNRSLPHAAALDLKRDEAGAALQSVYARGFSYADCTMDDARLVVTLARDAAERGARIEVGARVTALARIADGWRLTLADGRDVTARAIVNAAGPWVAELADTAHAPRERVRLVQGSHIVVKRLFENDDAYIFQQRDGRVVFAIPFERDFTLIGTTDRLYEGDPARVAADADEIAYLCAAVSAYFRTPVSPDDVVWTFAGVRALADNGAREARKVTRDYKLAFDAAAGAPILSLYGGKITTHRALAEAALSKLRPHLPKSARGAWTARAALPGGDFPRDGTATLVKDLAAAFPFLSLRHALRLSRAYGTRACAWLAGAARAEDMGEMFVGDLSAREVDYLIAREWARTAQDVLWRRTKFGLRASPAQIERLEAYIASKRR